MRDFRLLLQWNKIYAPLGFFAALRCTKSQKSAARLIKPNPWKTRTNVLPSIWRNAGGSLWNHAPIGTMENYAYQTLMTTGNTIHYYSCNTIASHFCQPRSQPVLYIMDTLCRCFGSQCWPFSTLHIISNMHRILNCTMKYTFTFLVTLGIYISLHLHSNIIYTEYVRHLLLQQL
jgi:hypothetical protein